VKKRLTSDAMSLVVNNEKTTKERLSQESKDIIASLHNKYNNVCRGLPFKAGDFRI